ncbi:hypothetical protein FisN_2Hh231 [Fistulifera solaris]|uniref:Protein kinase domain-containing protein n=1 Tax=Fistulifera solaris TaxID=1519565 RepID=A0A1Z5JEG9_FISSO|nr:hypothetical protein FisN_2Hh231 [Fistulifera solaris]|eukprot:GAX12400.1 hypothetical protein FisN_2Hh231 [Fistulifera solaris]
MKGHRRQKNVRRWVILLCFSLIAILSLRQFRAFSYLNTKDSSRPAAVRVFYFHPNVVASHRPVEPVSERSVISEYVDFMSWQPWEHDRCHYPVEWQTTFYPTCNILHELEHTGELAGSGYWRQGWLMDNMTVLKRALLNPPSSNAWDEFAWGLYKSQVEGMCLNRLKNTSHVLDLYAWCATSTLIERAEENFADWLNRTDLNSRQRLSWGRDVARLLWDVHSIDAPYPTIAHNDFRASNLLIKNNTFYAGDFNQAILLQWDSLANDTCRYKRPVGLNNFAPPPERKASYKKFVLPVKMDIYELGNILYQILTSNEPRHDWQEDRGYVEINTRRCVTMPDVQSLDYHSKLLYYATLACHAMKAIHRPSSYSVWKGLEEGLWRTNLSDEAMKRLFDPSSVSLK